MIEYASNSANTIYTIWKYKNNNIDHQFKVDEFTYHFITSDSLIIYNRDLEKQYYEILKLSNDSPYID